MGVMFHFKQWGEWLPETQAHVLDDEAQAEILAGSGPTRVGVWSYGQMPREDRPGKHERCFRVGKARAGRLLDGRTHDEVP